MKVALLVLWRVLFYRPLILVMLVLVYSVAALLLAISDAPQRGFAIALVAALPAAGLSAVLTERVRRYCIQASVLGLPDHTRILQRVQGWFLALFVGLPLLWACSAGANPLTVVAALIGATGLGIVLASYGGLWIFLVPIASRIFPLATWAQQPAVQALAVCVGGYLIWRWFELPQRAERFISPTAGHLADARHERATRVRRVHDAASNGTAASVATDAAIMAAVPGDWQSGRPLAEVLGLGFGYSVHPVWRRTLYGALAAILVLTAWSALHASRPAIWGYAVVTAGCCFGAVGRLQVLLRRWMQTPAEQTLLRLTPLWPAARRIKWAVIATMLLVQRGSVVVWLIASAAAALLGSSDGVQLLWGGIALAASSLATSGAMWAILARRRIRDWHVSTICIVLTVMAGAFVLVFATPTESRIWPWVVGLLLMLLPPGLALVRYLNVPLRFPLDVDPRAMRSLDVG